ncbi:MAG: hypothetical protein ALECFALPRED_002757 [Alectoria fallacina]|uniref:Uncharacterized protein n=1 Tax=Alectoria fallacina TaxID=1903189 RepID=A0A8H3EKA4_9LECA|nr:MAG: hypothetical protein ALECFALPRED_002757 [Alectoria fallacina]
MSIFSQSGSAPRGETIDLTTAASASSSSVPPSGHTPQLIDLTMPDPVSGSPQDHMHTVVALLWPGAIDLSQDTSGGGPKGKAPGNTTSSRRKALSPSSRSSNVKAKQAYDSIGTESLQRSHQRTEESSMSSTPSIWNPIRRSESSVVDQQHARKFGKIPFKPFPFIEFPPEIRNCVYKMLLTTPKTPIEFPEPIGRNRALRAANWERCTTWKMRRRHKTIFLEILEVSKQLHAEACGILYGGNIFKYRSDYGKGPRQVILPTRHLQLLKHIKISIISGSPHIGQDQWVADLVKQFVKEGLRLETFEMTWFGWKRYHLRVGGLVCQALLCLDVERHLVIKVTGEARMDKETKEELERVLRSRQVEIHRPVKALIGEDLSDEDEVPVA